jgi:hypothetical protein
MRYTPNTTDHRHSRQEPHLPLEEAGERTGLIPNRLRHYDATEELEYEGTIEWAEGARYARGDKHYGRG